MPLDSATGGSITGKGDAGDAAIEASQIQADYNLRALDETARQYDESAARLQPFVDIGADSMASLQSGSTQEGLEQSIASILGGDSFSALKDERMNAATDQLSRAGLTRSGYGLEQVANIPTDLAFALESMLNGRQANLVGSSQNAASGLGSLGAQNSSQIFSILQGTGDSIAQGIIGGAQADAQSSSNLLNTGASLATAALMFSDPRLKENMEKVGEISHKDGRSLSLYEWDWIEGVTPIIGEMNIGFDAEEVADKFPHRVGEIHGFKAVDYHGLIDELKESIQEAA